MKLASVLLTALLVFNVSAVGEKIEELETLKFPEESATPLISWDFCQTGDGVFIIPDYRAGNIKIYEKNEDHLELVKTTGRKGYGPDGLLRPTFCSFSKEENKLVVMDHGIRKIFFYSRLGRVEFKRDKIVELPCWRGGSAMQLRDGKLFISGYADDNGKDYDFYFVDLITEDKGAKTFPKTFLLPSHYKYNLAAGNYEEQYKEKYIPAIGRRGFFAVDPKGNAYFAWEGDLRIIKVDTVSGEIDTETFGKYTNNYTKPSLSPALTALVKGYKKGDFDVIQDSKKKMSLVRGVFTTENHLLVIFEGPVKEERSSSFWLHFYSLNDGSFQKEVHIPGAPNPRMSFDKDKKILYSFSGGPDGSEYYIQAYRIIE
jgi:hypothetical protein